MELLDILKIHGLDPKNIAVVMHSPKKPEHRRMLPAIVNENEPVFDAYQSVHSTSKARTIKKRKFQLSFVNIGNNRQLFVGLYEVLGWEEQPKAFFDKRPAYREIARLEGFYYSDLCKDFESNTKNVFNLRKKDALKEYRGRLVIKQPKARNFIRLAENMKTEVLAIYESNQLSPTPPDWHSFILGEAELKILPKAWASRLREWRGVYLIVDESDGARYVGSAYGEENLLGRWQAHVAGEQGVTKHLSDRNPVNFRFSILQLLAPDAEPSDVINIEHNWMNRLHTREFGLNT